MEAGSVRLVFFGALRGGGVLIDKPREIELYTCNKYPLKLTNEEIVLCNAPNFCDSETKQRRHCTKVKVIIQAAPGSGT